jgi:acyl-[acyl carrier protein]--UDP-N-acetylglucosamine O-acyltransferase
MGVAVGVRVYVDDGVWVSVGVLVAVLVFVGVKVLDGVYELVGVDVPPQVVVAETEYSAIVSVMSPTAPETLIVLDRPALSLTVP